ncbi:precorrin-2 dehydrogenase/sirohydrochlorin ferrochelatase family protein [Erythrobacter sp. BLCC-B19]|uniref:precorrin-2 dehydrogenase/sirohydrochlorin ferrochelatase family protein n=1 Tax=Erythrobacter sp. BLCC-B19 TaxID=3025315 RepID=UPI00235FBB3A|nr:bifunctional precorrin-2 dehydrogenase/sirohydrochlorin ferrochelatase [Erythrobacter sp. BLCC-B19]WDA40006.1 bifunctional precorrin-2 dehydrogenase/sirohydrochlorin ferrochelatase [Erythrobacter sp. BLCC-B19]
MSRIASLPLFHQIAGQQILVLGDGPAAEPKRRLVERAGGVIVDDLPRAIDEGVRLAFIAYEDAQACEVAAINARCAGMLVNVVDRPELCDFTTPSILDRDPLLVAIGTGGASAGLAKHVRLRLERVLPQSLGALARALEAARPLLRKRFPEGADRRRAIDAALREGGPLDPLDPGAHERVADWAQGVTGAAAAITQLITVTSPDPEDLTLRQARLLGEADVLLISGDVPPAIIARARADAERRVFRIDGGGFERQEPLTAADRGEAPPPSAQPPSAPSPGPVRTGLTVVLHWQPEY